MADLIFSRPRHAGGPVHLVFGGAGGVVVVPDPVTVSGTTVLGGISGTGLVVYDNRNPHRASTSVAAHHQVGARRLERTDTAWGLSARELQATHAAWQQAAPLAREAATGWDVSARAGAATSAAWGISARSSIEIDVVHQAAARLSRDAASYWDVAHPRSVLTDFVHQAARLLMRQPIVPWQVAARLQALAVSRFGIGLHRAADLLAPWETSRPVPPGREVWPPVNPNPFTPHVPSTHLVFACPRWLGGPVHLVFGHVCTGITGPVAPLYILPARYYMAVHSLVAHRLPDLTPIPIFDLSLSADAGSFGWTFSASAPVAAFDALAPSAGLPAQVRFTLDGLQFVFAVDSLQREDAFGRRSVRFAGRSATALLARPYARETSRDNAAAAATAQQLAEAALEFTGVGLDWGLTDWLVPAGAWSHSGTPLAAVQAVVEAAGGYLQSHRSAATLLARHPYPELAGGLPGGPWNWTAPGVVPDVELSTDSLITTSIERRDGADVNGVYVSGTTQGVLALVRRDGTAADKLASLITDQLITAQEVALQRGLSVLGAAGPKHLVQVSLPVLTGASQPGVLDVGQLVQVNTSSPWRGRVRGVSVSAAHGREVRQSVQIERHLETV